MRTHDWTPVCVKGGSLGRCASTPVCLRAGILEDTCGGVCADEQKTMHNLITLPIEQLCCAIVV